LLLIAIAGCIAWYAVSRAEFARDVSVLQWMGQRAGHAAHTSIVLCGVVLSLIFFDEKKKWSISRRFLFAGFFAIAATIAARVLRPYYTISKIYATPSWCLYSVLSCIVLYCFLYWLIDRKGTQKWTLFFQPAASNPLLIYILPGIVMFVQELFHIYFTPASWHNGLPGIAWSACFAVMMMLLVMLLNKMKIRLHL
jgi:predicted acyltransferase